MSLTKIGSIGINTGIQFAGVTTVSTLHVVSGVTLSSDGDVFATGISTFSEDIKVGSGVTISPDGDGFYTGVVTATTFSGALAASSLTGALPAISGANLTNLDASDLASGTVPTARLGSGTASSSTFLRGDSTFQTVNTDLVSDTSPQLGGNLDLNGNSILLDDDEKIFIGTSNDGSLFNSGSFLFLKNHNGAVAIQGTNYVSLQKYDNSDIGLQYVVDGAVKIYYDNSIRIETSSDGGIVKNNSGGGATKLNIVGPEGHDGILNLIADDGDDDADHYRLLSSTDGSFYLQNYTSGSWEFNLKATGNGAVELYHDNVKKLETGAGGIKLPSEAGGAQLSIGAGNDFHIEHDGSNTYLKNVTGNTVIQNDAVVEITASSGGTKRFRFDSDGLKFGSDTAAANALDDYEEGTFTPRLGGSSNSSTYFVSGYGWYRKIGAMVYTCVRFNGVDLNNSASGDVKIHNLPFTCDSAVSNTDSITTDAAYFNVNFNTSHQYAWYASNGGTSWVGLVSRNSTSWDSWSVSDFHSSSLYINFSGWYQTNS